MLCDYRPKKNSKAKTQKKFKFNQKLIVSAVLIVLIIVLSFFAIKIEFVKFYQLKENERVLLLKNQKPIAYLFFNVNNKQITVTDLREINFDLNNLDKTASFTGELNKTLFYAFFLNTVFDHSYDYTQTDLDKDSLLTFFKDKKPYHFFLQDRAVLWREQTFDSKNSMLVEPVFDCPVAIINTTSESGLANSLAIMLEKSSFSIIKKDSNTENLPQTKVFYNPSEKSCGYLLEKLDKIFPPSLVSVNEAETLNHRASLVIYIGKDLADLYNFFISKNFKLE